MTSAACGARKRNGEPCGAVPMKGQRRCGRHGGKSPQAKKAAERRLAEQKAAAEADRAVRTLGITEKYSNIDPGKALLEEISVTYAHVQWLRGKVAELEGNQLVWGRTQHEDGIGPEGPIDKTTMKADPSVWYQLYLREREHLVKVTTAALKAGIEERKVRLAESQGELVARVIRGILESLNLTAKQWELVQTVVPQQLRALADE